MGGPVGGFVFPSKLGKTDALLGVPFGVYGTFSEVCERNLKLYRIEEGRSTSISQAPTL